MRVVFAANVLVAGIVGIAVLFGDRAASNILEITTTPPPASRITGAFWLAIALVSVLGAMRPETWAPVLVIQLLYKGAWLLAVVIPAFARGDTRGVPLPVAGFFAVWVGILPFVIPWGSLAP